MNSNPRYKTFSLPKAGNTEEEYEDAFYPHHVPEPTQRYAIADGASEACYAKSWADIITEAFVDKNPNLIQNIKTIAGTIQWLKPYRDKWDKLIPWDELSFFHKQKTREGAYCTFLGFELTQSDKWRAWAKGDCELFQIRDDDLIVKWPIDHENQFGAAPDFIYSIEAENQNSKLLFNTGLYKGGDTFILTTDALAAWMISQYHANKKPWAELCKLKTNDEFADFINEQRLNGLMRNDDATLIYIKSKTRKPAALQKFAL